MKTNLLLIFSMLIALSSCKKAVSEDEQTCININKATIIHTGPVTIGQPVSFNTQEVGGYRLYSWHGPNNFESQYPENDIDYAELKHEGWYYLSLISVAGDCQKIDSFYLDVKLQQGTAPCTVTTNSTTYSNLFGDSYTSVTKGIDPNFSQKYLDCSGGIYSNLKIYFHTNWRTKEPEDGIYTTINTPVFPQTDYNYNKVFITTTKNSMYWSSHENQQVYVSHVGTKLQVRFCDLNMSGYNGTSYFTAASGNVIEQ